MKKMSGIVLIVVVLLIILGAAAMLNNSKNRDIATETSKATLTEETAENPSEDANSNNEVTASAYLSSIEATVLSVELDELENEECGIGILFETSTICPRDKAVIRIDSYENIDSPNEQLLNLESEIVVYFEYSARPAKLLKDRKHICEGLDEYECPPAGGRYSHTISPQRRCEYILPNGERKDCEDISIELEDNPTEIEEGFIIYHFAEDYHEFENDITLPGINIGDQIKFTSNVMRESYKETIGADSQIADIETYELIFSNQ